MAASVGRGKKALGALLFRGISIRGVQVIIKVQGAILTVIPSVPCKVRVAAPAKGAQVFTARQFGTHSGHTHPHPGVSHIKLSVPGVEMTSALHRGQITLLSQHTLHEMTGLPSQTGQVTGSMIPPSLLVVPTLAARGPGVKPNLQSVA